MAAQDVAKGSCLKCQSLVRQIDPVRQCKGPAWGCCFRLARDSGGTGSRNYGLLHYAGFPVLILGAHLDYFLIADKNYVVARRRLRPSGIESYERD